ncbi:Hsp20/alpha crystallin family protein [Sideroxydans lithotrophicus]|uniref:Heat shock protein Hsp20 n=1 Tax=Sideroxydans lithotrophicus (strain ES-1) TaxID=580332 RepID=D5CNR0_SIDLE|nr:Hsp20/alpha crystallin family protein [Sideroxydans lithotrophicus]ADE10973.1 heat shock protein Hsp20 [Sideroxydans lithotrophicus ES-1]
MANITRFSPTSDVLDDLFRGFFMQPVHFEGQPEMRIRMDVSEDDRAYKVYAEIPGVKKEDIHVNIDGNQVSISAEVKSEKEVKEGEKLLRSERYYGSVSRDFSVVQDVDEGTAQAKYSDGILELTLPKKKAASSRKLVIQ